MKFPCLKSIIFNLKLFRWKSNKFCDLSRNQINLNFFLIIIISCFVIFPSLFDKFCSSNEVSSIEIQKLEFSLKAIDNQFNNHILDINRVGAYKIKKILNFDLRLCKRIIAYRNLLGGFIVKEQYNEIYYISKEQINLLKKQTFIEKNFKPKKINIKNCSFKELLKHPYITYQFAKTIFELRKLNNDFNDLPNQIKSLGLNPKIKEYLILK